jgi:hypothetical protein
VFEAARSEVVEMMRHATVRASAAAASLVIASALAGCGTAQGRVRLMAMERPGDDLGLPPAPPTDADPRGRERSLGDERIARAEALAKAWRAGADVHRSGALPGTELAPYRSECAVVRGDRFFEAFPEEAKKIALCGADDRAGSTPLER